MITYLISMYSAIGIIIGILVATIALKGDNPTDTKLKVILSIVIGICWLPICIIWGLMELLDIDE